MRCIAVIPIFALVLVTACALTNKEKPTDLASQENIRYLAGAGGGSDTSGQPYFEVRNTSGDGLFRVDKEGNVQVYKGIINSTTYRLLGNRFENATYTCFDYPTNQNCIWSNSSGICIGIC